MNLTLTSVRCHGYACTILITVLLSGFAHADRVVMKNGDQLTGHTLSMAAGKLAFKTPYSNQIEMDWDQVAHLTTDAPMELAVDEETTITGKLVEAPAGLVALEANGGTVTPVRAIDVTSFRPSVDKDDWQFTGEFSAGIIVQSGNTEKKNFNVDANATLEKKPHRVVFFSDFNYEINNDQLTDDNLLVNLAYDYFLNKKWFLFANEQFKRDRFADLNALSSTAAGPGYQFWQSEEKNLSFRAGPSLNTEHYSGPQSFLNGADSRTYAAAFWGLDFDIWAWRRYVQFFHKSYGLFSMHASENWRIITRTGFRVPLFWKLFASIQYNFDYVNQPADGRVSDDRKLLTKLGLKW